ncbi:MAG: gamma-glutamylcyclotransferase [Alphaproteobacteria bacterium]
MPLTDQARRIAHAEGILGTNFDYLKNLMDEMGKLEIDDPYLTALWTAVERERG